MTEKTRSVSVGDAEPEQSHSTKNIYNHHDVITSNNATDNNNSAMNASQISTASSSDLAATTNSGGGVTIGSNGATATTHTKTNLNITHNIGGNYCRFPKLEECAHFHYERVQLGKITVRLVEDKSDLQSSNASQHDGTSLMATGWFIMKVSAEKSDPFLIRRSIDNLKMLDEMLHRCVYDRKVSCLRDLSSTGLDGGSFESQIEHIVGAYLVRFSNIASDSLTCGPVLTWFQLDNKGRRLPLADMDTMKSINTPAVGAAYGIKKYIAQACDEISIDVGDMISVIDMPSPAESTWWRGKKSHVQKSHYEVGFFPQSCVATIGDKIPRHLVLPAPLVGSLAVSPTKPVLRKHGKLIAFFRSFILSRPSRRRLKQSGIYKERVFSCDLSEHLLNSGQDIPMVLKCCAEFIEEYGIVDGIYRLSGITSNIQKLRRCFDEERVPDLTHPDIRQDIHALSSLLKMYFRELPNPLCTYQLYDNFVDAIQTKGDSSDRLKLMKETVQKLPPPHYRTLKYLATHLNTISHHSCSTGMTDRNLAIVWAPNLLRSPALEAGGVAALRGVGVQAVVTEYLITNCNLIFEANDDADRYDSLQCESFTDTESIQIEQREHLEHSLFIERPKSLSVGGPRLISLEEAQTRQNRLEFVDVNKSNPINTPGGGCSSYIEVGGGPSSLPDKYHTVLPVPRSWQKRKTHSWKSLFSRNARNSSSNQDIKNSVTPTTLAKQDSVLISSSPCREELVKHISLGGSNQEKMAKSVDIYDSKPMEICVRSNSIDSLRTAGHSRSVSHDSYFDLLQSPLRATAAASCASRELSELGINFDREEPEMRIFSESESLVSSPKIAKETTNRRILRSRQDEYQNGANNIIPSPKKQPRLNLQSPPANNIRWTTNGHATNADESMCKRYKLEDQLSDIQFIDCSTPEHTVNNPNTIYASVQIHNPPTSNRNSTLNDELTTNENVVSLADATVGVITNINGNAEAKSRYSYPVSGGYKHLHDLNQNSADRKVLERFSYPVLGKKLNDDKKFVCRVPVNSSIATNEHYSPTVHKKLGRFSYCDPATTNANNVDQKNAINLVLRSSSAEMIKQRNDVGRSKLSIATPSSPVKSPGYSLLIGETSSENSSSINTPLYEMETGNGITCSFPNKTDEQKEMTNSFSKESGAPLLSDCGGNTMQNIQGINEFRDSQVLKRELSLDLDGSKMSVDDTSLSSANRHILNLPSTPNTPNFTSGNTSQSMTPSEFGYQHLNRHSAAVSSPDSSTNQSADLNVYEQLEHSFGNYENAKQRFNNAITTTAAAGTKLTTKLSSPIKSTISITYNVKSPVNITHENVFFTGNSLLENGKHHQADPQADYEIVNVVAMGVNNPRKTLLETSFDENMVYEQVKFFKGAVSEVNSLLDNGNEHEHRSSDTEPLVFNMEEEVCYTSTNNASTTPKQIVPNLNCTADSDKLINEPEVNSNLIECQNTTKNKFNESFDVPMCEQDVDIHDSLESDPNISLYENVELRKPASVYANIEMGSLNNDKEKSIVSDIVYENVSQPKKVMVRELANKFETSPVDSIPIPFDFSKPFIKKLDNNRNSPCLIRARNNKQLHKSAKITRSLDENAFIREFGKSNMPEYITANHHSVQQINSELNATPSTPNSINRRMSLEFIRPKSLNPPKRLPNLDNNAGQEICKYDNLTDVAKIATEPIVPNIGGYDLKITPTTENPISLIQQNVNVATADSVDKTSDDERNVYSLNNIKVGLGNFKLDRDRIEKIKEERRHQLNEQFRTPDSSSVSVKCQNEYGKAKSKSKIELRDIKNADRPDELSLRFKSKSRGDIRNIRGDIGGDIGVVLQMDLMETTGLTRGRVRRISDEKNQNDCIDYIADVRDNKMVTTTIKIPGRKFIDKKPIDIDRDRNNITTTTNAKLINSRNSITSQREKISPQFSIRDVAAMFESKSQNQ